MNFALMNLAKNQLPPIPREECSHMGTMTYADLLCWCDKCGQKWRRYPGEDGEVGTGWITEQTLKAAKAKKKRRRKNYGK